MVDQLSYRRNALAKLDLYIAHGYYPGSKLIATWETKNNPLDLQTIESTVHTYLL